MTRIRPQHFHRLALAVTDVDATAAWLERILGALPMGGAAGATNQPSPAESDPTRPPRDLGNLAGTETRLLWVGGYPVILLGGGAVARFLQRYGPGVQSFAWEVDDNWVVEHIVRDRGINVISVNVAGRFFFMDPKNTDGVLIEWCDGKMPRDARANEPGTGLVTTTALSWASAVVADADATARWMAELIETETVTDNATGPDELERTIDLAVGDITIRLITPMAPESRYAAALQQGPRVHSFSVRVPDLDAALATLEREGIPTVYRSGLLAATDPAATHGLRIDWTQ
jgi:catechol 2,3-dioxygenase-like lactoylglutathione lyase family enzyme